MAGLSAAKASPQALPAGWLLAGAFVIAVAGVVAVFLTPRFRAGIALPVAAVFLAGAASYEIHRARLAAYDALPAREARLTLRITHTFPQDRQAAEPQRAKRSRSKPLHVSGLARIIGAETHLEELVGQNVYFSLALPPSFISSENARSDIIRTAEISGIGMLAPLPRRVAEQSFDDYLVSAGMNFKLVRGRILALEKQPTATAALYERARLRFNDILSSGLAERPAQAGILRAMVLGQKRDIDEDQTTLFLSSGTMHLFAISGLHIVVIATGIQFLLLLLRLPLWTRIVLGTFALYLYVQITGASPSAMRAFVMVALLQASILLRLPVNGIATLSFAALLTLLAAPMQLFSASFQMSYGIVAALLLYGAPLGNAWLARFTLFRDIPKAALTRAQRAVIFAQRITLSAVGISVAASLVSAICGTIYFKLFTPGSILANLVLIPAASLVILSGFLSITLGLLGFTAGGILFNHASALILLCMEKGVVFFLKIPGVSHPAQFSPATAGYCALALLLASMFFGYANKWTLRRGGFWLPAAVVAAALAFCVTYG